MTGYLLTPITIGIETKCVVKALENATSDLCGSYISHRILIPDINLMFCWNDQRVIFRRIKEFCIKNEEILLVIEFSEQEICELMDFVDEYTNILCGLKARVAAIEQKTKKHP